MKTIPLTDIQVPENRQRTELDPSAVGALSGSIFAKPEEGGVGLINPITLREGGVLVAGQTRMAAIALGYRMGKTLTHKGEVVPAGHVPYIDFGELSIIQQQALEYAENAIRTDLTWQDNQRAIASLHALRTAQAAARGEVHLAKDTAQELFKKTEGINTTRVSTAQALVRNMDNPLIAKAKSATEAAKILKKIVQQEVNVNLAREVGKTVASDRMRVFNADCLEWMAAQPGEQYDVILTDPPYGMGADNFGDGAGTMAGIEHQYQDGLPETQALLAAAIPEFFRLAKPEAHLYLWCDIDLFHWLRAVCREAGWWTFRTPLVNVKSEGGRVPWPENGPRRSYELCLFAVKGKKPVNSIKPDVFTSRMPEANLGHGAQKPVEAYVELLGRSTRPGDRVLDTFVGTGTIFEAAAELGLFADGVEMAEGAFGIAVNRIRGLK